jgi:hypothetical protein
LYFDIYTCEISLNVHWPQLIIIIMMRALCGTRRFSSGIRRLVLLTLVLSILRQPWYVLEVLLAVGTGAHGRPPQLELNVPWLCPECALSVPWMCTFAGDVVFWAAELRGPSRELPIPQPVLQSLLHDMDWHSRHHGAAAHDPLRRHRARDRQVLSHPHTRQPPHPFTRRPDNLQTR